MQLRAPCTFSASPVSEIFLPRMRAVISTSCVAVLLLVLVAPLRAQPSESVAVLLSREIAPYATAVAELESSLRPRPVVRFFLDDQQRPYSLEAREAALDPRQYVALVAIGPEALRYLAALDTEIPLVFGMVLDPRQVAGAGSRPLCGVDLSIPVVEQLTHFRRQFPRRDTLGVLFDPANNQAWFDQALLPAAVLGIDLVPLNVSREQGRLDIVGDFSRVDALLFIPDRSIISQTVIQYVIKQGLQRGRPAVGFNRFFLDSGAALAFLVDYQQVGSQIARLVEQQLTTGCHLVEHPVFAAEVNESVLRLLRRSEEAGGGP